MIKFSVIIPLYNKQNFVLRAINSVLTQNYFNFELIVVNDGSTDDSLKIVSTIKDFRIKLINKVNEGVSTARNVGIDAASNCWICFLDGDDYWLPNHLEEIAYLLRKYPEGKIYSTLTQLKSNRGIKNINNSLPINFEGYIENYFFFANTATVFNSSSVCINKIALIEIGKFDPNLTHGEDLDVWFKLLINFKGVLKLTPTVIYNLISENRAMESYCNPNKHLLSKIYSYRDEKVPGLNDFIDYFILRNSVPYYFSNDKDSVIFLIDLVKFNNKLKFKWKFIYFKKLYSVNFLFYKIYKKIRIIISFIL